MTRNDKRPATPSQQTPKPESLPTTYSQPGDAQRIRDLLLRANLSQRAAARELGVDERTMRYWCAGENTPPRMAFLALEHLAELNRQITDTTAGGESDVAVRVTEAGTVVFTVLRDGAVHECEIAAPTLSECFGAKSRDPAELLRAFNEGRPRIHAAAHRRQPQSGRRTILGPVDFKS